VRPLFSKKKLEKCGYFWFVGDLRVKEKVMFDHVSKYFKRVLQKEVYLGDGLLVGNLNDVHGS
jgi:hypothetical protein